MLIEESDFLITNWPPKGLANLGPDSIQSVIFRIEIIRRIEPCSKYEHGPQPMPCTMQTDHVDAQRIACVGLSQGIGND